MHACIGSEESPGPENGVSNVPVNGGGCGGRGQEEVWGAWLISGNKRAANVAKA